MTTHADTNSTIQVDSKIKAHLLDQLQDASKTIRKISARVMRSAEEAIRYLDEGYNVNAHGVLQGSAAELDQAAALRNAFSTACRYADCTTEEIRIASLGHDHLFTAPYSR